MYDWNPAIFLWLGLGGLMGGDGYASEWFLAPLGCILGQLIAFVGLALWGGDGLSLWFLPMLVLHPFLCMIVAALCTLPGI